ncbi:ribosomal protein S5-alanine N-acetyltransferase [Spirochaeta isovalerica]|uniref:Ribosomal-protein-alanine N-acetyltransferase n=1 Tax=Spirochaeta isovalerica TaxID=150 RepID=A0A841RDV3_9SPIO|nr:ribosomal-protein-alanine N-acetyltransferase [Spirochaeta isovalerica]
MLLNEPILNSERTEIYIQNPSLINPVSEYYRVNADFLRPWEPAREESYFTREAFCERLELAEKNFHSGMSVQLAAFDRMSGNLAGIVNFTGIIRGPFQACFLGYSLSESFQGRGYMHEILTTAIAYMFNEKRLHRIMANYMPRNGRSGRLLEKLGFEREGLARDYLLINGKWEDHILTSLIRKD